MGSIKTRWIGRALVMAALMVFGVAGSALAEEVDAVALFDDNTGIWTLTLPDGDLRSFYYGNPQDVPMMGDWDCDGDATVGMYRPANGFVYIRNTNDFGVANYDFFYGNPGDVPVAGDWDGDGCTTLAIHRGGSLYVSNTLATGFADFVFEFGIPGHIPFAADFNSDGKDSIGFYDPIGAQVYWRETLTAGLPDVFRYFGNPGDQLVAGDWGTGSDSISVVRGGIQYYEGPDGVSEWAVAGKGIALNGRLPVPPEDGVIKIEPIGDSITEGNPGEYTYRYFLDRGLAAAGYDTDLIGTRFGVCCDALPADPNFDQDHQAWSGAASGEIADRVIQSESTIRPDIAVLHVGTNDIWGPPAPGSLGTDPANPNDPYDLAVAEANLERLIDSLRRSNPDVGIVLSKLLPCDFGLVCSERIPALNEMIASLPDRLSTPNSRIVLVDTEVGLEDLTDGVHPNRDGQEQMAVAYQAAIVQLLTTKPVVLGTDPIPAPIPGPIPQPEPIPPKPLVGGLDYVTDISRRLAGVEVGGRAQRNINSAVNELEQALSAANWNGDRVATLPGMRRIAEAGEQVERALERLGGGNAELENIEDQLLTETRLQALAEIVDVGSCSGDCAGLIEQARGAYDQGVGFAENDMTDEAADKFADAWDAADRAGRAG